MRKSVFCILLSILLAVLLFSSWKVIQITKNYEEGATTYEALMEYVVVPSVTSKENVLIEEITEEKTHPVEYVEETTQVEDPYQWPSVDFEGLNEINPDVVGWIYMEGTSINYPIVQGKNNDYYLRHLIDGTYNSAGCIFLDSACSSEFASKNNIIYGHNMKNGTMFHILMEYKKQEFYDEHPVARLMTPNGNYEVVFFSGFVAKDPSDAWEINFLDGEFDDWIAKIKNKSAFASEIQPMADDRILTLSTCTYEFENARFVLYGIMREVN